MAALLIGSPAEVLNTARNWWALSERFARAIVSWLEVPLSIGLQVEPPLVDRSHCSVGVGGPEAVASHVTVWPSSTVLFTGCLMSFGAFGVSAGAIDPCAPER